jgi:hypothetical protein
MLLGWVVVRKISKAQLPLFLFPFAISCLALLLRSFPSLLCVLSLCRSPCASRSRPW